MARTKLEAQRASARNKPIQENTSEASGPTEGYSCTLYQDYLVFYGGKYEGRVSSEAFVYNLKEKRIEKNQCNSGRWPSISRFSHSACLYEKDGESIIIFYGGKDELDFEVPNSSPITTQNIMLRINANEGNVGWNLDYGLHGSSMLSPISNIYQDKLYLYQPGEVNTDFEFLRVYDLRQWDWLGFSTGQDDLKLSHPSDCAIFCDNNLYVFAENEDNGIQKRTKSEKIFEDVYVLNLVGNAKEPRWQKISPGGQAPGLLTDVSMTAANGIIYVFGVKIDELDGESKAVLWTYDTNEERWSEVKEIGTLTAGPNQRAVVYKNQLLIVDWSYPNQLVNIQYLSLNNMSSVGPSSTNKRVCKDQSESFIQDSKNLYNGRLFADITFEVEGEEIPAHKAILAYRSDYFMKMFTSGMSESHSARISIPNIKPHIFKALLQYIYCNEIELDEQLALDLIPIVDEYLMKGLKGLVEKYLCKQLRKDNAVDMLIVADRHEIEELKKACFRYILKNLGNIDENEEMMKLSKSLFIELLKFNTLSASKNSDSMKHKAEEEEEKSNYYEGFATANASTKKVAMTSQGLVFGAPFSTGKRGGRKASPKRRDSKNPQ